MPKIDRLFAFIMQDKGVDDEGVMAMRVSPPDKEAVWVPLIGADMNRVNGLTQYADDIAKLKGKPYKIVEFHKVSEVHRQPEVIVAGGEPNENKQELETESKTGGRRW